MRIEKENTAVLVVDFQEKLMPVIHDGETVVQNSVKLLKGLGALDIPFVMPRQYPKGLGEIIPEIQEAVGEHTPLDKVEFSACQNEGLLEAIKATGKKNIIVCGTEAHICVLQSVIDLKAMGFVPILVCDCIGSRKPYDVKIAIKRAVQEGALVTTHEAILYELLVKAGGEAFKTISRLIK